MQPHFLSTLSEVTLVYGQNQRKSFPGDNLIRHQDIQVELTEQDGALEIAVSADGTPLRFLALRWQCELPMGACFLGDAWERSYGELQWRTMAPARLMPWYFLLQSDDTLVGYGVMVRPAAFAQWRVEPTGVTLLLDLRNGRDGVRLGGRRLAVATVVTQGYSLEKCSAFTAAQDFCHRMCLDPLLPEGPVIGANNWYYAYGNITHDSVLGDSRYLMKMAEGLSVHPYMVIDEGWQVKHWQDGDYNGGPWDCGNQHFPDLPGLAAEMNALGVRPGIWFRPLLNNSPAIPQEWHLPIRDTDSQTCGYRSTLDPSRPEVLEWIKEDVRRLVNWGFQLIKHDFTTFDLFGRWGFQMNTWPLDNQHSGFADQNRTAAEIVMGLYHAIREAAGNTLILGCNTFGHLAAGLTHISRTGDDTSGYSFDRTCRMGVNTLAFRLCQHQAFFAVDADCVGVVGNDHAIPWEANRQWTQLLAASGTAFFTSVRPEALAPTQLDEMRQLYRLAASNFTSVEPIDWLSNNLPAHWRLNGQETAFDWFQNSLEQSDLFA